VSCQPGGTGRGKRAASFAEAQGKVGAEVVGPIETAKWGLSFDWAGKKTGAQAQLC